MSSSPATGTPELVYGTSAPAEQIYVMKQCGSTIYVGGTFSEITWNGSTYDRSNVFAFSATAPYTVSSWNPGVNGNVQAMAFDGGNCDNIFVGGSFSKVAGTSMNNLAEVSTTTGAVNTAFKPNPNGEVDTMIVHGSHLLTGGDFTSINGGNSADKYYTSLNVSTGKDDRYLQLNVSGNYQYSGVVANPTRIYAQQASHGGSRVMVEGDFMHVGGQPRQQIFQLWLSSSKGVVTGWSAPVFNTYCVTREPMYAKAAAWAPNDNGVYVATTGDHVYRWAGPGAGPAPCDRALAFSANESKQNPTWTNPTGCDSLLSVAADDSAVYFAGHERWTENPNGCNVAGSGSIQDYGMEGLDPANGDLYVNSQGSPAYTMARANGEYMMVTSTGVWIGSTNRFGDNTCNGVSNLSGICYLPYP